MFDGDDGSVSSDSPSRYLDGLTVQREHFDCLVFMYSSCSSQK